MTRPVTILVVEDFQPTAMLLQKTFEKAGFKMLQAGAVAEAIASAKAENPDLILMDVALPDGGGLDATRELRKTPETAKIPIIAMSGMHPAHLRHHALRVGCSDYLSKPFKIYDLTWRIQQRKQIGLNQTARRGGQEIVTCSDERRAYVAGIWH